MPGYARCTVHAHDPRILASCSLLPAYVLCLAAARLASRRVAPGPPAVLGLLLALPRCGRGQGRGPASASLAAAFGTAQLTPLAVCA